MSSLARAAALAGVFGVVALFGMGLTASRAAAIFTHLTETGRPGFLQLAIDPHSQLLAELVPGDSASWLVQASLRDASSSTLELELQGDGSMIANSDMRVSVTACDGSFQAAAPGAHCSGARTTVLDTVPLSDIIEQDHQFEVEALHRGQPREFLVTLSVPAATPLSRFEGQHSKIGLGLHVAGEDVTALPLHHGGSPALAATGEDVSALATLALGTVGFGLALLTLRRRQGTPERRTAAETRTVHHATAREVRGHHG